MNITDQLWVELESKNPSEDKIHELIANGADIKGCFLKDLMFLIYPPDMWDYRGGKGLELKFVKLLIDLGAEVNFTEDGTNCLWEACDTYTPELVELLLKEGANPNCISTEIPISTLEEAEDLLYIETQVYTRGCDKPLEKIIDLLKQYGAKTAHEIRGE